MADRTVTAACCRVRRRGGSIAVEEIGHRPVAVVHRLIHGDH